jgi:hypothetical protein
MISCARQIERLGERQKLVGIEPDAGAKGSLEKLPIGCRRGTRFGRSQVGTEALRSLECLGQ